MGLFSGPTRAQEPEPTQERGMTWPYPVGPSTNFAQATVSGTGALASVAVSASTDLICSLISELPIDTYSGSGSSASRIATPENIKDPGRDGLGREDWTYQLLRSWLHRGNAYGDPIYTSTGKWRGLSLFEPDSVTARLDTASGQASWTVNGVQNTSLKHLRVNPMAGVLLGFSPVEANAVTILSSIAATRFGYQWFTDGTHPQSLLVNTESTIDAEQARVVLERWRAMKSGTREPAVLGKGWEFRGLDITPEQSQLMEMVGMNEAQACRSFGPGIAETLGYESGGSMTYANVQDRRSDLLVLTLGKWARRVERVLTDMLPSPQFVKLNRDALLETTTMARYQVHRVALASGFRTINEVRKDEDMAPVPWGDEPLPVASTTVGGSDGNAAG